MGHNEIDWIAKILHFCLVSPWQMTSGLYSNDKWIIWQWQCIWLIVLLNVECWIVLLNIELFCWILNCFVEYWIVLLNCFVELFCWMLNCFVEYWIVLLNIELFCWILNCFVECWIVLLNIELFCWILIPEYCYKWRAIPTSFPGLQCEDEARHDRGSPQSRTQSNACVRARMALALGKLTTGTPKFRGSGSLSACTIDKR
jgi:hypothetical protein